MRPRLWAVGRRRALQGSRDLPPRRGLTHGEFPLLAGGAVGPVSAGPPLRCSVELDPDLGAGSPHRTASGLARPAMMSGLTMGVARGWLRERPRCASLDG